MNALGMAWQSLGITEDDDDHGLEGRGCSGWSGRGVAREAPSLFRERPGGDNVRVQDGVTMRYDGMYRTCSLSSTAQSVDEISAAETTSGARCDGTYDPPLTLSPFLDSRSHPTQYHTRVIKMPQRKGLLIGINYIGSENQLSGYVPSPSFLRWDSLTNEWP
jgi:hypothetical protein